MQAVVVVSLIAGIGGWCASRARGQGLPPTQPTLVPGTVFSPAEYAATFLGVPVSALVEEHPPDLVAPPDLEPPEGIWVWSWSATRQPGADLMSPVPVSVDLQVPSVVRATWKAPSGTSSQEPQTREEVLQAIQLFVGARASLLPPLDVIRCRGCVQTSEAGRRQTVVYEVYLAPKQPTAAEGWRGLLSVYWDARLGCPSSAQWIPPRPWVALPPTRPVEITLAQAREAVRQALQERGVAGYREVSPPSLSTHSPWVGEDGHPFYLVPVMPDDRAQYGLSGTWYVDAWTGEVGQRQDFAYGRERLAREAEWRGKRLGEGRDPYYPAARPDRIAPPPAPTTP